MEICRERHPVTAETNEEAEKGSPVNEPRTIEEQYTSAGNADDLTVTSERRNETKPCPRCGGVERRASGKCAPCDREASRQWHLKNKEKASIYGAAYREEKREEIREKKREWYHANRDLILEERRSQRAIDGDLMRAAQRESYRRNKEKANGRTNRYYKENKERILAQQAQRYQEKRDEVLAVNKRWAQKNIEKSRAIKAAWAKRNVGLVKEKTARRRAVIKSSGSLSKGIVAKLHKLQRGRCACCGERLGDEYHLDHILPLARGGTNTDDNVQLLTAQCNLKKHAKHPIDYMQEKGLLL